MTSIHTAAIEVLRTTDDGERLSPHDLLLVERAINHGLDETDEVAFYALHENARTGYAVPWFHGIEHLTIDHLGFVYWKGQEIEHFESTFAYSARAVEQAHELERRCKLLEAKGSPISTTTVVWQWHR